MSALERTAHANVLPYKSDNERNNVVAEDGTSRRYQHRRLLGLTRRRERQIESNKGR